MGHSSLIGIDLATLEPGGRDRNALGPGDSSDTGSDMVGVEMNDEEDPGLPVDVALRDDMPHPLVSTGPSAAGGTSDAARCPTHVCGRRRTSAWTECFRSTAWTRNSARKTWSSSPNWKPAIRWRTKRKGRPEPSPPEGAPHAGMPSAHDACAYGFFH